MFGAPSGDGAAAIDDRGRLLRPDPRAAAQRQRHGVLAAVAELAQLRQSRSIFSGTHTCGTIVKPRRTKCDGSCVNAHSVAKPLRGAVGRELLDQLRTDVPAARVLVDDERADFGDLAAERRQLGAADDRRRRSRRRGSGARSW